MKSIKNLAIVVFILLTAAFALYAIEEKARPGFEKMKVWKQGRFQHKPFYRQHRRHRNHYRDKRGFSRKNSSNRHRYANRNRSRGNGLFKLFAIADELNISNTQLIQLRLAYDKCKTDKNYLTERAKLKAQLNEKDIKFAQAKEIITKLGQMRTEQELKKLEIKEELKKVLSSEQLEKLETQGFHKMHQFNRHKNHRNFQGIRNYFPGFKKPDTEKTQQTEQK
jgi:Spy/CpxP family protein refolding chaperone